MVKKLVLLYVGEPRAIEESLKQRDKLFKKFVSSFKIIESRYLICFIPEVSSNNKKRILKNVRFINCEFIPFLFKLYLIFFLVWKKDTYANFLSILDAKIAAFNPCWKPPPEATS